MTATRSAIPTPYRGYLFRSRLEATWAAFFDLVGWSWEYEPVDADGYIPDFWVRGPYGLFVEVGPCLTRGDYTAKSYKADLRAAVLGHDLMVVGVSPLPDLDINGSGAIAAGWLGEWCPDGQGAEYSWDVGVWAGDLGDIGVYHSVMGYHHRPHGGRHEDPLYPGSEFWLRETWAQACNATQWRPQ